jgi:hypothetical protein
MSGKGYFGGQTAIVVEVVKRKGLKDELLLLRPELIFIHSYNMQN